MPPGAWERITVIKYPCGKKFRAEARYGGHWKGAGPCDTPYEALDQAAKALEDLLEPLRARQSKKIASLPDEDDLL